MELSDSDSEETIITYANPTKMDEIKLFWKELLKAIPHDRHKITPEIAEKLAQVVHDHFEGNGDTHYIRKTALSPRHVLVDKTNKQAYIFSKIHGRKLPGGVDKTPSDVIHVTFEEKVPSNVQHKICLATSDHVYTESEIKLEKLFGLPCEFISYLGKDGKVKTKMIQEAYDSDLDQLEKKFSHVEFFKMFYDVAIHLDDMHKKGFIHGDIKFANIIVKRNPDGSATARLADFGYTHNNTSEYPKSQILDTSYGTQIYTAPERLRQKDLLDDPVEQGKAEDMFALGCVLMRMMYGRKVVEPTRAQYSSSKLPNVWKHLKRNMPQPHPTPIGIAMDELARSLFNNRPGKRITTDELLKQLSEIQTQADSPPIDDDIVVGEEYVLSLDET
jgi:hypothetical protein